MTAIATVTTVGGGYSRWLSEWVDGLLSQTRRPDETVVVVNGDEDELTVRHAVARLERSLPEVRLIRLPWTHNYGRARNVAVASTRTVWAHHADVDDVLLPNALEQWQQLQHKADVVAFGWRRLGNDPKGSRRRSYSASCGQSTLKAAGPASGLSPFRRSFWQQRPYDDRMPSAWDTSLWRGFGHLNARFVPTLKPAFMYRYHPDSIFQSRRAAGDPDGVGRMLERAAASPSADVMVVVPWRDSGDPDRQAAWQWLKRRWASHHPDWPLVEADCDGEWNKPKALNGTIARLDCRVLVVADADCTVEADELRRAVSDAQCRPWVVPHGPVWRMDEPSSRRLYDGPADVDMPQHPGLIRKPYAGYPGGGMFVIGRAQWDRCGGFDPQFRGWGAEDESFALAADSLLGRHVRYHSPLWHLYHHPGLRSRDPHWKTNRARLQTYRRASKDRRQMADLVGVDI